MLTPPSANMPLSLKALAPSGGTPPSGSPHASSPARSRVSPFFTGVLSMKSGNLTPTEPRLDSSPRSHRMPKALAVSPATPGSDARMPAPENLGADSDKTGSRGFSPDRTLKTSKSKKQLIDAGERTLSAASPHDGGSGSLLRPGGGSLMTGGGSSGGGVVVLEDPQWRRLPLSAPLEPLYLPATPTSVIEGTLPREPSPQQQQQQRFVLAPTPAQLGRAPGQLHPRKNSGGGGPLSSPPQSSSPCVAADLSENASQPPPPHGQQQQGGGGGVLQAGPAVVEDREKKEGAAREEGSSVLVVVGGKEEPPPQSAKEANPAPPPAKEAKKSVLKRTAVNDGMDRVLEEVNFKAQFAKLPEYKPEESPSGAASLPSSPFVQTYRKRPKPTDAVDECGGDVALAAAPKCAAAGSSPVGTPHTPQTAGPKLEGTKFFGPSFSLDVLADTRNAADASDGDVSSPRTPKTPAEGEKSHSSSLRRVLEQRRQLVMQLFTEEGWFPSAHATAAFQQRYRDVFTNKNTLQLKIREVRQKLMAQNNQANIATTPSAHDNADNAAASSVKSSDQPPPKAPQTSTADTPHTPRTGT